MAVLSDSVSIMRGLMGGGLTACISFCGLVIGLNKAGRNKLEKRIDELQQTVDRLNELREENRARIIELEGEIEAVRVLCAATHNGRK